MNSGMVPIILSLLVTVATSTVAAASITAFVNRKKLDVDVTKTKADAASILSKTAMEQTQAMGQQVAELRVAWRAHREWDKGMVKKAREHGIDYDDPPDLWI